MNSAIQLFLALTLITFISAFSPDPCKWTDPNTGNTYDFSSIQKAENYRLSDYSVEGQGNPYSIDFIFNFCQPMSQTCNGKSNLGVFEALSVLGQITDECQIMGMMDQMEVEAGTSMGSPGVRIVYRGGETCTFSDNPSQDGAPMHTTFNIVCGHANDNQFKMLNYNGNTRTKCTPEFYIQHPAGCVGGVYRPDDSSSFGFIHWAILIIIVYIAGGIVYNFKVQNKKGLAALSHIAFWNYSGSYLKGFFVSVKETLEKIVKKFRNGQSSAPKSEGFVAAATIANQRLTGNTTTAKYTLV